MIGTERNPLHLQDALAETAYALTLRAAHLDVIALGGIEGAVAAVTDTLSFINIVRGLEDARRATKTP